MEDEQVEMLSPWNPLDHLRLLKWLFLEPARLQAYREQAGEEAVWRVGAWTASTLSWFPLLVFVLAVNLRTFPLPEDFAPEAPIPFSYHLFCGAGLVGFVFLGWALTGWTGQYENPRDRRRGRILVVFGALFLAVTIVGVCGVTSELVEFGAALDASVYWALVVPLFVVFFVVRGIAVNVAGREVITVVSLFLIGVGFDLFRSYAELYVMGDHTTWGSMKFLLGAGTAALVALVSVRGTFFKGESRSISDSTWRIILLGLLLLSYIALVWLCLLGGWQVFA